MNATLDAYLERLREAGPDASLRTARNGKVVGRFFQSTLTSVFQAVREIESGHAVAFEGLLGGDDAGYFSKAHFRKLPIPHIFLTEATKGFMKPFEAIFPVSICE